MQTDDVYKCTNEMCLKLRHGNYALFWINVYIHFNLHDHVYTVYLSQLGQDYVEINCYTATEISS